MLLIIKNANLKIIQYQINLTMINICKIFSPIIIYSSSKDEHNEANCQSQEVMELIMRNSLTLS